MCPFTPKQYMCTIKPNICNPNHGGDTPKAQTDIGQGQIPDIHGSGVRGDILRIVGPSGVHALPLGVAAERSVHYIWDYFSFSFWDPYFFQEVVVLWLFNFAQSFKSQKRIRFGVKQIFGTPTIFLTGILIFLLLRSPCKISEPYNNPFWDFIKGGEKKKWNQRKFVGAHVWGGG